MKYKIKYKKKTVLLLFPTEIGWYLLTTLSKLMQVDVFGNGFQTFRSTPGSLSLNTWSFLGMVYEYQTGK
jgi:hypothetical protein